MDLQEEDESRWHHCKAQSKIGNSPDVSILTVSRAKPVGGPNDGAIPRGTFTASKQRPGIFTVDEQEILNEINPIIQSIGLCIKEGGTPKGVLRVMGVQGLIIFHAETHSLPNIVVYASVAIDDILGFAKLFNHDHLDLNNISRIKNDEKMIQSKGGVDALYECELHEDCRERGMLGLRSAEELCQQVYL
ncbi:hypothetical protein Tco_0524878 [Tanacetum coccineum]